jgi:DNA-binding transcriptional MerR regulator
MRIGELSRATGLSHDTLRFYETRGLIAAARTANGYRHYPAQTLQTLLYVRTAQRLGFSLGEIADNLRRVAMAAGGDAAVRELLRDKLAVIDARLAELTALRRDIATRLADGCPLRAADENGVLPAAADGAAS